MYQKIEGCIQKSTKLIKFYMKINVILQKNTSNYYNTSSTYLLISLDFFFQNILRLIEIQIFKFHNSKQNSKVFQALQHRHDHPVRVRLSQFTT